MIREVEVLDIPRIYELGELVDSNFRNVYNLNEVLNDDITKVYAYIKDDLIVGFIMATDLGETCDILCLVVDPLYRRQLIGSNLINYLIGDLSPELKLITLEVRSKNKAAINLYEKFGFVVVHVRKNYYKDDDALLMARKTEE